MCGRTALRNCCQKTGGAGHPETRHSTGVQSYHRTNWRGTQITQFGGALGADRVTGQYLQVYGGTGLKISFLICLLT